MDEGVVVPTVLFLAVTTMVVTYILAQARTRRLLVERGTAGESYAAVLTAEARLRTLSALRWGLTVAGLALGLIVADALGHRPFDDAPGGGEGIVLLGVALGLLAYYALTRQERPPAPAV
ncbi:MAG TPA: hypothetical protein VF576_11170 [Rubricoccaceae bacterium]|jgi:hypothetical protein